MVNLKHMRYTEHMELQIQLTIMGVLYCAFTAVELLMPAEKGHTVKGRLINLVYTAFLLFGGGILSTFIFIFIPVPDISEFQYPLWYSAGIIILGVIANDFLFYWYHRAQHSVPLLWKIHKLHHEETKLNAMASLRTHFLESPIQAIIIGIPVSLVTKMDTNTGIAFGILLITWLFFGHSNIKIELGKLSKIICGPQVHRIHHSIKKEHFNKNFAQYLPLFDVLFGTYCAPKKGEFPKTGLHN